jgi:phosphoglycolate phosphatase-like HAD superfamily hydrolase
MSQTCVVFDLDETLISTTKRQFQVINFFFDSNGIELDFLFEDYKRTRSYTKKSNLDIFRFLNTENLNEKDFQFFFSKNIESKDYLLLDELIVNLGLMQRIKFEKGYTLILLSLRSSYENSIMQLHNLCLYDFFDEIYFEKHSSQLNPKTNRLKQIHKKYPEIQFIGDSKSDLEAAEEASIEFIKVNTGVFDFNFSGESFYDVNLLIKSKYGI